MPSFSNCFHCLFLRPQGHDIASPSLNLNLAKSPSRLPVCENEVYYYADPNPDSSVDREMDFTHTPPYILYVYDQKSDANTYTTKSMDTRAVGKTLGQLDASLIALPSVPFVKDAKEPRISSTDNAAPSLSYEQYRVLECVKQGQNVFFTGSAGMSAFFSFACCIILY